MEHAIILGILLSLLAALLLGDKWQLELLRVGITVTLIGILAGVSIHLLARQVPLSGLVQGSLVCLLTVGVVLAILVFQFYRDPERTPPDRTNIVVSPADGTVIYIRKSTNGVLPVSTKKGRDYQLLELTKTPLCSADAVVIGIGMSLLNVHVNRVPFSGQVVSRKHFPGLFGSLRKQSMVFENERATTVVQQPGFQIAVVQIASRLVRQIAVFVREGQDVTIGQRLGVIRLGSQVDVVLTARENLKITTQVGDRVRAGELIIAELE